MSANRVPHFLRSCLLSSFPLLCRFAASVPLPFPSGDGFVSASIRLFVLKITVYRVERSALVPLEPFCIAYYYTQSVWSNGCSFSIRRNARAHASASESLAAAGPLSVSNPLRVQNRQNSNICHGNEMITAVGVACVQFRAVKLNVENELQEKSISSGLHCCDVAGGTKSGR